MCGIVALLSDQPIAPETLTAATSVLAHRGPDGQRTWLSADRCVGLGHRRLAIVDLSPAAAQPLTDERGEVHVVVNGEFYDHERIRAQSEKEGHRFRTRCDSEILLPLYKKHGLRAVEHLRGEFAFALWDARERRLFAARDRFGIKPLFYAVHGGRLYLASEIKALLAAGVAAEWDWETINQLHSVWAQHPHRTLFKDIFQVPPGHRLIATVGGAVRFESYWDFNYPTLAESAANPRSEADMVAQVRAHLDEAVRLRLRADVPVGVYLSGGLDSCAALGLAARQASGPLRAFTLSFDHAAYDERAIAEEMARHAGAQLDVIAVDSADFAAHFTGALRAGETLIYNPSVVAKYLLSRHVHDAGCRVVLTGEGSDEIFGGYPHFRTDMFRHLHAQDPVELARQLEALHSANPVSIGTLLADQSAPALAPVRAALGAVPTFLAAPAQHLEAGRRFFSGEFRARFAARNPYAEFIAGFDVTGQLAGRHPVDQALYLWSRSLLPTYLLSQLGDRMEMAHSVEGRLPFLDHALVECVTRLPAAAKIKGTTEKHLLREAVRDVITDTVYRRQKHPFMAPPVAATPESPFFQMLQDTLRSERLKRVPFYEAGAIIQLLDALPQLDAATRHRVDPLLMAFLSVAELQEQFHIA